MQPPVFLADRAALASDVVVLSGAEGRHAATVRRLRPGERADVADGAGLVAECVVARAGAGGLELTVQARREVPRPDPAITVVQAIPKGDRGELAVEEMTEVGVDRIVPWAAARCVPVWQGARGERSLARWRLTAREAAKQSRRAWIPEVTDVASAGQVAQLIAKAACAIVLEPGAARGLGRLGLLPEGRLGRIHLLIHERGQAFTEVLRPVVVSEIHGAQPPIRSRNSLPTNQYVFRGGSPAACRTR